MKRLASIGLLALLLYNTFGLSLAILLFDKGYEATSTTETSDEVIMKMYLPSLPYSGNLEIDQRIEGLVRQNDQFYNPTHISHENDTLYVTMQSNQAARDHFFELANAIQVLNDPQTDIPQSPYGKAMKLLGNLLKIYLPNTEQHAFPSVALKPSQALPSWHYGIDRYLSAEVLHTSPPPEAI